MPSKSAWKLLLFACGLLSWSAAGCSFTVNEAFDMEHSSDDLAAKVSAICPVAKSLGPFGVIKHIGLDTTRYAGP